MTVLRIQWLSKYGSNNSYVSLSESTLHQLCVSADTCKGNFCMGKQRNCTQWSQRRPKHWNDVMATDSSCIFEPAGVIWILSCSNTLSWVVVCCDEAAALGPQLKNRADVGGQRQASSPVHRPKKKNKSTGSELDAATQYMPKWSLDHRPEDKRKTLHCSSCPVFQDLGNKATHKQKKLNQLHLKAETTKNKKVVATRTQQIEAETTQKKHVAPRTNKMPKSRLRCQTLRLVAGQTKYKACAFACLPLCVFGLHNSRFLKI